MHFSHHLTVFPLYFSFLSTGCHANAAHHRIHAQHQIPGGPQPGCVPRQRNDAGCLLEYPVFGRWLQLGTAEQGKSTMGEEKKGQGQHSWRTFACFPQMFAASICICHTLPVVLHNCRADDCLHGVATSFAWPIGGQFQRDK